MATEQVPQEEFHYHQLFKPPVSPHAEPDESNLLARIIHEKFLK